MDRDCANCGRSTKRRRTSKALLHIQATTSITNPEEIDALGGRQSISAWDARFELVYQKCKGENVTLVGGVAPTAVRFARYTSLTRQCQRLRRKHKVYPKDLW